MGSETNKLLVGAMLVCWSLSACSTRSDGDDGGGDSLTQCVEPRPEVCTMEYLPVCGQRQDETWNTYSNACSACSDRTVVAHRPGICSE